MFESRPKKAEVARMTDGYYTIYLNDYKYDNGEICINRSINVSKSMILSIIIICGSGHGYLELYKRFIFVIVFIILFVMRSYYYIWLWYAFVLIDTYFHANAKVTNKDIPKFFGLLKLE